MLPQYEKFPKTTTKKHKRQSENGVYVNAPYNAIV